MKLKLEYDFKFRRLKIEGDDGCLTHGEKITLARAIDPQVEHVDFEIDGKGACLTAWADGDWTLWCDGDRYAVCDDGETRCINETWGRVKPPFQPLKLVGGG